MVLSWRVGCIIEAPSGLCLSSFLICASGLVSGPAARCRTPYRPSPGTRSSPSLRRAMARRSVRWPPPPYTLATPKHFYHDYPPIHPTSPHAHTAKSVDTLRPLPISNLIDIFHLSSACCGTDEVFEEFDAENPLGAASIGQCHMARLKGSGKLVAVKVHPYYHDTSLPCAVYSICG